MQKKIQCPNCGATSAFLEKSPGRYTCAYCASSFEHVSILPNVELNKKLYEQIMELYKSHLDLKPEMAKYHQRILTGILQMNGLINGITDIETERKVVEVLEHLFEREIKIYAARGITAKTSFELKADNYDSDLITNGIYLKQLLAVWAYRLSRITDNESGLERATKLAEEADGLQLMVDVPLVVDLKRTRFGLLRRQGKDTQAFKYLDNELKNTKDKEQFQFDFEDIFLSSEYLQYQANNA
ncbi:hypothetical protein [Croceivirga thetidis]|uniref:TFIIB-type zinc ribbon-containing protein n=1 Tax=Croceivirga thetidis TaxID=2721623 RepID=A0ABX1GLT8_9FLAO|nr:hypothetical protein [Croceivirga thetidis]NKI30529.1 hypothetical protein [Croceivirga thetidis]